jgi:hypothetical protein
MKNENDIENDTENNEENLDNSSEKNINIKKSSFNQNFGELTKEQFELMKKIREETLSRTERYSELINDQNSKDFLFKIEDEKKKKKPKNKISHNDSLKVNNTIGIIENTKKEEINPNKERIYTASQPLLFIKGEPFIILGPDTNYYVWIFSLVSFFSIIVYSLKNSNIFFKILFICGYLFFTVTYTLLLILNPGIPTNKNNLDPSMLQKHYRQCQECNCIALEKEGKLTIHCQTCQICIEHFDHHCVFATKCIGKGNLLIFHLWLYSMGIFFVIIFLYLIF